MLLVYVAIYFTFVSNRCLSLDESEEREEDMRGSLSNIVAALGSTTAALAINLASSLSG